MIEPDKYAQEHFNLKFPYLQKEQTGRIYNFNKLPSDKKIVFVKFDVAFNEKLSIIERIDWFRFKRNKRRVINIKYKLRCDFSIIINMVFIFI